ncbi:hypothetical protein AXF14_04135 [Actinomyces radicidentis]|uniref:Alkaline phosphatase family protein n=1 Tax=Actinomyces radicidentis TaxID=111015 RepID=A0A120KLB5_ACTRD|nr:hypothetical protein AXF14_04135 [Actinomyces radicidentis]
MRIVVYVIVLLTVIGMVAAMVGTAWAEPARAATSTGVVPAGTTAQHSSASASTAASASRAPVIVLATDGLSWSDLVDAAESGDADARTLLDAAAAQAPVNLVQRTAGATTCPADAWLTLGAGARTRAVPASDDAGTCAWAASWREAAAESQDSGYGAEPGALADALTEAGVGFAAVGRGAVLALTGSAGTAPREEATLAALSASGFPALTVVDLTDDSVASALASAGAATVATATASPTASTASGSGADALPSAGTSAHAIVTALSEVPSDARVIVASLADPATEGLQATILPAGTTGDDADADSTSSAAVADAPLPASPSTHRRGLVQTTDLTATLAQDLTGEVPAAVTGGALTLPESGGSGLAGLSTRGMDGTLRSGGGSGSTSSGDVPARVSGLVDDALRARASKASTLPVSLLIVLSALVLVVVSTQVLRGPRGRARLHGTALAATVVAALPGGAWLASVVPWWRVGADGDAPSAWSSLVAVGTTALLALVLAGVLHGLARVIIALRDRLLLGRHRVEAAEAGGRPTGAAGAGAPSSPGTLRPPRPRAVPTAPALTALLLGLCTPVLILADAAAGAPLAFDGVLGMDAVLAGRFYGVSNTAFALAAAALTVGLGAAAGTWVAAQRTRRSRRTAAVVGVLAPGAIALLVDGLPSLGADVGGAITLVAVLIALASTLAGGRVGWKRWLSIAVVALATVGVFGLIDHATGSRTHLGRFVGQLQDGTAGTTILRKATAVIAPFLSNPLALLAGAVALAVVAGLLWWLRRELRAWRAGRSGYAPLVGPEPDGAARGTGGAGASGQPASTPSADARDDDAADAGASAAGTGAPPSGTPWAGPVPRGATLVPGWFVPVLKSLGVLLVVEVLVNDSGASMAVLSVAGAAPLLLALAAARLAGLPATATARA